MAQPLLFSLIDKAIYDYKMIVPGDRILLGASGGKDSTALIEYFAQRSKRRSADFEFKCIHIHSEITPSLNEELFSMFRQWDVEVESIFVDVLNRVKPGRKMNCYWCSTQRRTELLKYAMDNGYNKIALGHHLDDILETMLMNMLDKGEFATMPPVMRYDNYPCQIIRPLCYTDEQTIIDHGTEMGYIVSTCTCNYQETSRRKDARKSIEFITGGDKIKKNKLFQSMKNILTDYLP